MPALEYRISLQPVYHIKSKSTVKVTDYGWFVDVSLGKLLAAVFSVLVVLDVLMLAGVL